MKDHNDDMIMAMILLCFLALIISFAQLERSQDEDITLLTEQLEACNDQN